MQQNLYIARGFESSSTLIKVNQIKFLRLVDDADAATQIIR